ncbi:MAG: hydantoinase/oxoprolinase family protein, partial [Rhodospirillales bacterium]|nr:hydantoinase/oxoprolinase family protein [Rhodospirillales bacterium]
ALATAFAAMEAEGRARLAWFDGAVAFRRSADMRYGEQVFEIAVDLEALDWASPTLATELEEAFHRAHESLYTYALRDQDVVLVNARVSAIGRLAATEAATLGEGRAPAAAKGTRRVHLGAWTEVPVFDFSALGEGQVVIGPAIVESDTTTVLLRPGDRARYDVRGWLDIAVGAG